MPPMRKFTLEQMAQIAQDFQELGPQGTQDKWKLSRSTLYYYLKKYGAGELTEQVLRIVVNGDVCKKVYEIYRKSRKPPLKVLLIEHGLTHIDFYTWIGANKLKTRRQLFRTLMHSGIYARMYKVLQANPMGGIRMLKEKFEFSETHFRIWIRKNKLKNIIQLKRELPKELRKKPKEVVEKQMATTTENKKARMTPEQVAAQRERTNKIMELFARSREFHEDDYGVQCNQDLT